MLVLSTCRINKRKIDSQKNTDFFFQADNLANCNISAKKYWLRL